MARQKKSSQSESSLTPLQKQAVLVVAICALVLIVTISAVTVWVSKGHQADDLDDVSSSNSNSDAIPTLDLSKYGDTVLKRTDDAGKEYLSETLFVGDSNAQMFYQNGLMDLNQVVAVEGLTVKDFASNKSIYFKDDNTGYSIPEAIAKLKPRRIVMMMGTSSIDGSMTADAFAKSYKAAVDAVKSAYSYTDIVVAAVPPIPKEHSRSADASMENVNDFNHALAKMCKENNLKFLNIAEVLLDSEGYGKVTYFKQNDVYLKKDGLMAIMDYTRTHAYVGTEDRRPDTNDIPVRRTGTAGSETQEPTQEPDEDKKFTAKYNVDKNVGGTLESNKQKGVTSLEFKDLKKDSSITVKAVPNKGYHFVKWSDNNTSATRTDKDFTQNVNVIAIFEPEIQISIKEGSSKTIELGETMHLHAQLSQNGRVKEEDVVWTMNGAEAKRGVAYSPTPEEAGTYNIKVSATANNGKTCSAEFKLVVNAPKPTEKPTEEPTPEPTATPKPTAEPTPEPTATPKPTAEPTATPKPTETPKPEDTSKPAETSKPDDASKPDESSKPEEKPAENTNAASSKKPE